MACDVETKRSMFSFSCSLLVWFSLQQASTRVEQSSQLLAKRSEPTVQYIETRKGTLCSSHAPCIDKSTPKQTIYASVVKRVLYSSTWPSSVYDVQHMRTVNLLTEINLTRKNNPPNLTLIRLNDFFKFDLEIVPISAFLAFFPRLNFQLEQSKRIQT